MLLIFLFELAAPLVLTKADAEGAPGFHYTTLKGSAGISSLFFEEASEEEREGKEHHKTFTIPAYIGQAVAPLFLTKCQNSKWHGHVGSRPLEGVSLLLLNSIFRI